MNCHGWVLTMITYKDLARPVPVPAGSAMYRKICGQAWVAQEKVDGVRVLVQNDRLVSRHGRVIEAEGELRTALKTLPRDWMFDGELKDGVVYMFDVLHRESEYREPIHMMPLVYRWMVLCDALPVSPRIRTVRVSTNVDREFREWTANGAEGVVVKNVNDAYPPIGGAEWYKVKE